MSRIYGGIAAAVVVGALGFPGAAGAHRLHAGELTFKETYPLASRMCARVAAGSGPAHLRPFAAQVAADCATLQAQFNSANTTVLAAFASIKAARAAERAAARAACPRVHPHVLGCSRARKQQHLMDLQLFQQHRAAALTYWHSVEAARRAFWAAIHALPGGHPLHADKPIPPQDF